MPSVFSSYYSDSIFLKPFNLPKIENLQFTQAEKPSGLRLRDTNYMLFFIFVLTLPDSEVNLLLTVYVLSLFPFIGAEGFNKSRELVVPEIPNIEVRHPSGKLIAELSRKDPVVLIGKLLNDRVQCVPDTTQILLPLLLQLPLFLCLRLSDVLLLRRSL